MVKYLKYFLSLGIILSIYFSWDSMPLSYTLQYSYTSEEMLGLESKINSEIGMIFEGSSKRQAKWDTLIAINPDKEEYYRKKSFTHTRIGDYHLAFPLIEKAIKLDPLNALYFTGWQMLYMYRDYDRALANLSYYDDISEGVDYLWGENVNYLKGLAYKQLALYDQSVEEFDKCILYEGDNVSEYVYVYRGLANLRNECVDTAILDFDKALSMYPNCTMALVYKGEALLLEGRYEEPISNLDEAKKLLVKGTKKTHPYVEVFDEVHLVQVDDLLERIKSKEGIITPIASL